MGCVTDTAYMVGAKAQGASVLKQAVVDTLIQIGLALWQRNSSKDIANMQNEIADRQTKLAEAVEAHMEQYWPRETALVADIFGEQRAVENYHGIANGWKNISDAALQQGRQDWLRESRMRCSSPGRCEDARFQRMSVMITSDVLSAAARTEEARVDTINDRRWAQQYSVLQLGQGRLQDVQAFHAGFLQAGAEAYKTLSYGINTALGIFGYARGRYTMQKWQPSTGGWGHTQTPQAPLAAPSVQQRQISMDTGRDYANHTVAMPERQIRTSNVSVGQVQQVSDANYDWKNDPEGRFMSGR